MPTWDRLSAGPVFASESAVGFPSEHGPVCTPVKVADLNPNQYHRLLEGSDGREGGASVLSIMRKRDSERFELLSWMRQSDSGRRRIRRTSASSTSASKAFGPPLDP